jgi:hypothetical protein
MNHYHGHREFADQDEFNKAVSRALYLLYKVVMGDPDADDESLRAELANIQAFASRADLVPTGAT